MHFRMGFLILNLPDGHPKDSYRGDTLSTLVVSNRLKLAAKAVGHTGNPCFLSVWISVADMASLSFLVYRQSVNTCAKVSL